MLPGMELVGLSEIADLLVMTRAGADKLVKREETFPAPIGAVLTGRTRRWNREEVVGWAREKGRPMWSKTTREELAELTLIGPEPAKASFIAGYGAAKAAAFGRGKWAGKVGATRREIYNTALEGVRLIFPEFCVEMPAGWLDQGQEP
jgi:hypothetical protein